MKIAHYLTLVHLADGGVVRSVLDLCAVLSAAGHEVTLVSYSPRDVPPEWSATPPRPGIPRLRTIERPRLPGDFFTPAQLRRIVPVFSGSDVAHFHGPWEPSNTQLARACRHRGMPYIVSTHGMLDDWSMEHHRLRKRLHLALLGGPMLRSAHAVHCTARAELDQSSRWFPGAPTLIAPLVVDMAPFQNLPGPDLAHRTFDLPSDGRPRLLFLGRIHPKKGLDILLEATRLLVADGLSPLVLIAGTGEPGYRAALDEWITRNGLAGSVRFLGLVGGPEKVSLLQAADLLVLPTSQENFGLVLVEALAAGTPVVTTKGVDIWPELLQSGGAMIVERTAPEFAAAIQNLLANKSKLSGMSVQGREFALAWLEAGKSLARFVDCYTKAAGRTPSPRD